jgi:hypothetical protein
MQSQQLNQKLNLVIPVDGTTRGTVYTHTTPLSREVFEKYWEVMSKTFASNYQRGLSVHAGPRIAMLALKKYAQEMGELAEVESGLIPEMLRLTNVLVLEEGRGWQSVPYHEAKKWLDPDDQSEVENAVCFFTLNSALLKRNMTPSVLGLMASLWGALTTSLDCTAFGASCPTSTPAEPSATGAA